MKELETLSTLKHALETYETSQYTLLGPNKFTGKMYEPILTLGQNPVKRLQSGAVQFRPDMEAMRPLNSGLVQSYEWHRVVTDCLQNFNVQDYKKLTQAIKDYIQSAQKFKEDPSVAALSAAMQQALHSVPPKFSL